MSNVLKDKLLRVVVGTSLAGAIIFAESDVCQRRTKIAPVGRSKNAPLNVMQNTMMRVVPVVHRRDPRCFV
jgi:hypothetical protein